jgi:hypothetical protein
MTNENIMPPKDLNRWTVYGVSEENKILIKVLATKQQITVGEALNQIINEWAQLKKNGS